MSMLIEYVRKPGKMVGGKFQKGKPYGCLVSVVQGDTISLGWSLCSPRDQWDRDVAQNLAWARATQCEDMVGKTLMVPQSIAAQFEEFMIRSMKYFQTDEVTVGYGYEYTITSDDVAEIHGFKFIL